MRCFKAPERSRNEEPFVREFLAWSENTDRLLNGLRELRTDPDFLAGEEVGFHENCFCEFSHTWAESVFKNNVSKLVDAVALEYGTPITHDFEDHLKREGFDYSNINLFDTDLANTFLYIGSNNLDNCVFELGLGFLRITRQI